MVPTARRAREDQRGSVLVEFALVTPLFLALLLGIFTGGQAYSEKIALIESVREGARYGASLPLGNGAGAVSDWEDGVRNRVVEAADGDLTTGDVCVEFVLPGEGAALECGLADPPGALNEPAVHLAKIRATKAATLEFFFFTMPKVIEEKMVTRFERDTG